MHAKKQLMAEFETEDMGRVNEFLSMRFHFLEEGLFLEQRECTKQLSPIFSMKKCNPMSTPMLPAKNKGKTDSSDEEKAFFVSCLTRGHSPPGT